MHCSDNVFQFNNREKVAIEIPQNLDDSIICTKQISIRSDHLILYCHTLLFMAQLCLLFYFLF